MGTSPRLIGSARQWPCVGNPEFEMRSCGGLGSLSLVTLVPEYSLRGSESDSDAPVMVHLTVCREHLKAARMWLTELTVGDPVDTYSTEVLMQHWDQVVADMGSTPIWKLQPTG